jgi:hypothetical protein
MDEFSSATTSIKTSDQKNTPKTDIMANMPVVSLIKESQVATKSSYDQENIASDVLLAAGRHPTIPGLNSSLEALRRNLPHTFNSPVDLTTIQWEALDPASPLADDPETDEKGSTTISTVSGVASIPTEGIAAATPIDPQREGETMGRGEHKKSPSETPTKPILEKFSPPFYHDFSQPSSQTVPHQNSHLPKTGEERDISTGSITLLMDHVAIDAQMASSSSSTGSISSPADNLRKRRSSTAMVTPKAPKSLRLSSSPEPSGYKYWPCKWAGCEAQLHNYETLVRHVFYLHKRAAGDGAFKCQWEGCVKGPHGDALSEKIVFQFLDVKEWEQHVIVHLEKVKDVLGLGPVVEAIGECDVPRT